MDDYLILSGLLGSRFDHTMQNLNTLQKYAKSCLEKNIKIIAYEQSSILVFVPAVSELKVKLSEGISKETGVGLIPLYGEISNLSTKGLKWNARPSDRFSFGGVISSSNALEDASITQLDLQNLGTDFLLSLNLDQIREKN